LQLAQPRGVGRRQIHRHVIRHRVGFAQANQIVVRRILVRRVLVFADVEADHPVKFFRFPDIRHADIDARVVEAHPVDDGLLRDQPEQPRLRISNLRPRRDGADLDAAEAQPAERVDRVAFLVQPRRQTDAVGKFQAHHLHG